MTDSQKEQYYLERKKHKTAMDRNKLEQLKWHEQLISDSKSDFRDTKIITGIVEKDMVAQVNETICRWKTCDNKAQIKGYYWQHYKQEMGQK